MKFFEIVYLSEGRNRKRVFQSKNRVEAIQHFKSLGIGVFKSVREVEEPFSHKIERLKEKFFGSISSSKVPLEPYIAVLNQFTVMLDAGLPINECLEEILTSMENRKLHIIFTSILADIEGGLSLTKASIPFRKQLGEISISMFDLGEQTGNLAKSIKQLADILEEIHENRKKLKRATRYPITVLVAMAIAFSIVITMVVPEFEEIFKENGADLPIFTTILIAIKDLILNYGIFVIGGFILILIAHKIAYNNIYTYRLGTDKLILKLYLIGDVVFFAMMGRFVYIFDSLSNAGIPIIDSLNTSVGVVENEEMKQKLESIVTSIEDGKSVTQSFRETGLFESMVLQMIDAGERSGSMNAMLTKVSKYYRDRYQYIIDNVSVYTEPILLVFIAIFVIVLALGMFLPMWSLGEVVK